MSVRTTKAMLLLLTSEHVANVEEVKTIIIIKSSFGSLLTGGHIRKHLQSSVLHIQNAPFVTGDAVNVM